MATDSVGHWSASNTTITVDDTAPGISHIAAPGLINNDTNLFFAATIRYRQAVLGVDPQVDIEGLLLGLRYGQPVMSFYNNDTISDNAVETNEWHYIAWRYNADTGEQAIFVDGQLDKAETGHAPFSGTDTEYIGRSAGSDDFNGSIDELIVYPFPLTAERIYDIANPVPAGIIDVQIRFRELNDQGEEIYVSDWYETDLVPWDVVFTTWTFTVPPEIASGIYKIDLKSTDLANTTGDGLMEKDRKNERIAHAMWTGYAGHHKPQRVMFMPIVEANN